MNKIKIKIEFFGTAKLIAKKDFIYVSTDVYVYMNIFVYTYIYMYTCIYVYMYMHICIYVSMYIYTYICITLKTRSISDTRTFRRDCSKTYYSCLSFNSLYRKLWTNKKYFLFGPLHEFAQHSRYMKNKSEIQNMIHVFLNKLQNWWKPFVWSPMHTGKSDLNILWIYTKYTHVNQNFWRQQVFGRPKNFRKKSDIFWICKCNKELLQTIIFETNRNERTLWNETKRNEAKRKERNETNRNVT